MQSLIELRDRLQAGEVIDVTDRREVIHPTLINRLWTWISGGTSERIDRIQSYAEFLLSNVERNLNRDIQHLIKDVFKSLGRDYSYLKSAWSLKMADVDETLTQKLIQEAHLWKQSEECLDVREVTPGDINRLRRATQFTNFTPLLKDKKLSHRFFTWVLRFKMPSELFIAFPGLASKMSDSYLHDQLAVDEGANLRIDITQRKVELLFFNNQWVDLLNPDATVSLQDRTWTIREVFEDYYESKYTPPLLHYFPKLSLPDPNHPGEGVWYYPGHLIDYSGERFWARLKPVVRYSPAEASRLTGCDCDGTNWAIGIAATRTTRDLKFAGNHAYHFVAIPMDDGNYTFFPLSKFASFYPRILRDFIDLVFKMVPSKFLYPDPNYCRHEREHTFLWIPAIPKKGEEYMYRFQAAWKKAEPFHLGCQNCCQSVQEIAQATFPNFPDLFRVNFFDMRPGGFINLIFKGLRPLRFIHRFIFSPFSWCLSNKVKHDDKTHYLLDAAPWLQEKGFYSAQALFLSIDKGNLYIRSTTQQNANGLLRPIS